MQVLAILGLVSTVLASAGALWYKYKVGQLEAKLVGLASVSVTNQELTRRLENVLAEAKLRQDKEAASVKEAADRVVDAPSAADFLNHSMH